MKKFQILFSLLIVLGLLVGSFSVAYADETEPEDEDMINQNPVAGYLATLTGLDVEDILTLQAEGYGMGEIAKAYYLLTMDDEIVAEESETEEDSETTPPTVTYDELLAVLVAAKELGWGAYYMEQGLHPGLQGGIGWLFKKGKQMQQEEGETFRKGKPENVGPPEHANNDKDKVKGPKK